MYRSLILLLAVAAPLTAQEAKPADFVAKAAPFIDDQTLIVVRADLTKVQLEPFFGLLSAIKGDEEDLALFMKETKAWMKKFAEKGGRNVFVSYGASDFPNMPCVLIPIGESPEQRKDLGELLKVAVGEDPSILIEKVHGCMAVGTKPALEALKTRKAVKRPDLDAALEIGKDGPVQMAMALSDDARKIFEQIAPTLPDELGGGSITKMTRSIKWTSVTIGNAPKFPLQITIETDGHPESLNSLATSQELFSKHLVSLVSQSLPEPLVGLRPKIQRAVSGITAKNVDTKRIVDWDLGAALHEFKKDVPLSTAAHRMRSMNNMKQLMLALHSYHDVYGQFPTDIKDKNGKVLLSWRVRILPYLENQNLYNAFKLNEPWDSEHNKPLSKNLVKAFVSPRQKGDLTKTTYLAPLGEGFMWDQPKGTRLADVTDGTSNTIVLLEVDDDQAVEWTKPGDFKIDPKDPKKHLLGHYPDGFLTAFGDGSVRFLKKNTTNENLIYMLTRAGGEVLPDDLTKNANGKENPPTKK